MIRAEVWIQGMYVRTFEGFTYSGIEESIAIRGYWPNGEGVIVWVKI